MSHPTTKACLPRVEHVRFIPPCLRCRCRDCPAHPQTATRESQPEITPGWTQGGEAPSGAAPPPTTPNLPPQPEHTLLAGQSSRRSGGGRGDCHAAPGLANGSGTSLFQPRAVGPPMHIGAGRRSFRRSPSNAAWLTVLGRAPQATSFIGSRHVWVRRRVERRRGLRQSLASQVSPRRTYQRCPAYSGRYRDPSTHHPLRGSVNK